MLLKKTYIEVNVMNKFYKISNISVSKITQSKDCQTNVGILING